ncbi:hypothetical protein FB45DRAFT_1056913 [Roridomyces roridus]|uniref:RRM domain-containing protein n=1 Tax=Roridomyces roridus TaxID=1738132 RepID=A0AAD7BZK3_9AGAR|nr:hypothetical protein FB45DRAFT_1056913 [Roridomyces roridus]
MATTTAASPIPTPPTPSNDDIEAVIYAATQAAQNDPRTLPLRDTRTQLFVANLPYRVRWQDLKDLFRRAGTVLRADVSLGPDNRSRGYGTVLLATAEDAGRAVDMFSGYSWQGRILEVRADRVRDFDQPFPEIEEEYAPIGRNLFVGNLPFHVQWQDLKDLFRQAGTIVRADVALGPDGRSRGFGTVVFATEKDAHRAVGMFSGYEYNGRTLKVHYDKFSQGQQAFDLSLSGLGFHDLLVPQPIHSRLLDFDNQQPFQSALPQLQAQLQHLQLGLEAPLQSSPIPPHQLPQLPLPQSSSSRIDSQSPEQTNAPTTLEPVSGIYPNSRPGTAKRSPTSPHPHHPGPIALPPPPALPMPNPADVTSPNGFHPLAYTLTPAGLPPITPSMPPFSLSFVPLGTPLGPPQPAGMEMNQQPGQPAGGYFGMGLGTPTHAHFLNMTPLATPTSPAFPPYFLSAHPLPMPSPGLSGMGPATVLSPGAFWGRAGEGTVYGAPVGQPLHAPPHAHSPYHYPAAAAPGGSPGFFGMHILEEPKGYFDFPPAQAPPRANGNEGRVEREIMKGEKEKEEDRESERGAAEEVQESQRQQSLGMLEVKTPDEAEEDSTSPVNGTERARRHSSDQPPPSPMKGKRPPPLRLPSAESTTTNSNRLPSTTGSTGST